MRAGDHGVCLGLGNRECRRHRHLDVVAVHWLPTGSSEDAGWTVRAAYKLEADRAYLEMTAAVPYDVWRDAAQRSALADALPDPAGRVN